jgi:WD40 repeat protein
LCFSPDGSLLVTGSHDAVIRVWSTRTGELLKELIGHELAICSVAFSPDGRLLASGSADWTARLWDVHTWKEIHKYELFGCAYAIAWSPDGTFFSVGCGDHHVYDWHVLAPSDHPWRPVTLMNEDSMGS